MKKNDEPTREEIFKGILLFVAAIATIGFIAYLVYMLASSPRMTPTPVHYDFSSRNIGNNIGRESGEFGKGFFRGLFGKDKGGK